VFTILGVKLEFPVVAHILVFSQVLAAFGGHAICVPHMRSANGRNILTR